MQQCNVHLTGIALEVTPLRYVYVWHTCKPCNVPVTSRRAVSGDLALLLSTEHFACRLLWRRVADCKGPSLQKALVLHSADSPAAPRWHPQ
jgi:hypothetical protein